MNTNYRAKYLQFLPENIISDPKRVLPLFGFFHQIQTPKIIHNKNERFLFPIWNCQLGKLPCSFDSKT